MSRNVTTVSFTLPPELRNKIETAAITHRTKKSEVLRYVLEQWDGRFLAPTPEPQRSFYSGHIGLLITDMSDGKLAAVQQKPEYRQWLAAAARHGLRETYHALEGDIEFVPLGAADVVIPVIIPPSEK